MRGKPEKANTGISGMSLDAGRFGRLSAGFSPLSLNLPKPKAKNLLDEFLVPQAFAAEEICTSICFIICRSAAI